MYLQARYFIRTALIHALAPSVWTGVVLAAIHDPLVALAALDTPIVQIMLPLAGLLYVSAAALFMRHAWPRIAAFRALPPRTEL